MTGQKVSGDILETVSDLLVYRKFDECLEACLNCLETTRQSLEIERNAVLSEGMCLVAIQAYAELDRWSEVLPFVTQLYNGIEDCPATVAQACLLLHAKMEDYPTCTAITNIWLRNKNNFSHTEYHILLELYIGKVLIPLDRWTDIPAFVDACPGLQQDLREQYKKQVKALERKKEQAEIDKIHELKDEREHISVDERPNFNEKKPDLLNHTGSHSKPVSNSFQSISSSQSFKLYAEQVALWAKHHLPVITWGVLKNLALVAVVLYLLLMRSNLDMLSKEGWLSIWALLVRLWRSMFSPYHLVKAND